MHIYILYIFTLYIDIYYRVSFTVGSNIKECIKNICIKCTNRTRLRKVVSICNKSKILVTIVR